MLIKKKKKKKYCALFDCVQVVFIVVGCCCLFVCFALVLICVIAKSGDTLRRECSWFVRVCKRYVCSCFCINVVGLCDCADT